MADSKQQEYRVLARKYRPQNFDELIGQDALVQTLKNAIDSGRIAHAFMLTGVRGVGKTTTARIIAKALNYTGPDGKSGPTTGDTSDCETCKAIAEDRHPDVMEMDAASRTGVDNMREILDGVRYAPVSARYKIYIIDEVHMLSTAAFNALLKTLEEPPSHVKFIFATTDIRKVPVTVLSRCQRFDLRRVAVETLKTHFQKIASNENVAVDDDAMTMIAKAADGSVRDGLSLLDQAIALNNKTVTADLVSGMLGATDRVRILDLLEASLAGNPQNAIAVMHDLYRMGADPQIIIQDMMDMVHALSMLCVDKNASAEALPHAAIDKAQSMASKLTVPQLQKSWQILLKGLGEMHNAPNPQKSAEMVVLRLIYAADLPDPSDLLRRLKNAPVSESSIGAPVPPQNGGDNQPRLKAVAGGGGQHHVQAAPVAETQISTQQISNPTTMQDMVALFESKGEFIIAAHLYQDIACIKLTKGHFEFVAHDTAPADLAGKVRKSLQDWTGNQWMVSLATKAEGKVSLAQQAKHAEEAALEKIKNHPNVKAVMDTFPDTQITRIFNPEEEDA